MQEMITEIKYFLLENTVTCMNAIFNGNVFVLSRLYSRLWDFKTSTNCLI